MEVSSEVQHDGVGEAEHRRLRGDAAPGDVAAPRGGVVLGGVAAQLTLRYVVVFNLTGRKALHISARQC